MHTTHFSSSRGMMSLLVRPHVPSRGNDVTSCPVPCSFWGYDVTSYQVPCSFWRYDVTSCQVPCSFWRNDVTSCLVSCSFQGRSCPGGQVPEGVWYYHPCEQTNPCENTVISKIFMISDRLFGVEL